MSVVPRFTSIADPTREAGNDFGEELDQLAAVVDESAEREPAPWIDLDTLRGELRRIAKTRTPTGIPTLDAATRGGLPGGVVVLLVGRPGSCKTALAVQLGIERARRNGGRLYAYAPDQGGQQPLERLAETFGNIVEDEDAFARFKAEIESRFRVIDERRDGVTIETFREGVIAAGDAAAVLIDTPQTVATAADMDERQRIDAAMGHAGQIARRLGIPVFVCSHANRAATAARKKEDRTSELSAGLGSASTEHRVQVHLFMERIEKTPGDDEAAPSHTEVDVAINKVTFGHGRGRFRLRLDPSSWTLREVNIAEDDRGREERDAKAKAERRNLERSERRERIMQVILAAPAGAWVSLDRIRDGWGKQAGALAPTLAVLVEEGMLELKKGESKKTGGARPHLYRLAGGGTDAGCTGSEGHSSPPVIEEAFIPSPRTPMGPGGNDAPPSVPIDAGALIPTGNR